MNSAIEAAHVRDTLQAAWESYREDEPYLALPPIIFSEDEAMHLFDAFRAMCAAVKGEGE